MSDQYDTGGFFTINSMYVRQRSTRVQWFAMSGNKETVKSRVGMTKLLHNMFTSLIYRWKEYCQKSK